MQNVRYDVSKKYRYVLQIRQKQVILITDETLTFDTDGVVAAATSVHILA